MTDTSVTDFVKPGSRYAQSILALLIGMAIYLAVLGALMVYLLLHADDARLAIEDCVKPTGKCFSKGQKRTAGVVNVINDSTIAAVACAQKFEGEAAIRSCVARSLEKPRR